VSAAGLPAAGLRTVEVAEVAEALAEAMAGGRPIAPLPSDSVARQAAEAMLRPDEPVVEPDAVAIVATSGSTGAPKGVVLSRAAVTAAAEATHRRLGGPGDWVLALPAHYVAGLMVLARAHLGQRRAVTVRPDLVDLAEVVDALRPPRYVSLVPTQLVRALADPAVATALARFDAVLIGGGPLDPVQRERAETAGLSVVTTYGMSETAGGCFYDGVALDGVTARINLSGRILIDGPTLFSGYRLRPDLTADALDRGWLRTPDRGRIEAGRLIVAGRLDDLVITGGLKVDRSEVEHWVRRWAGGRGGDAVVVGVPDEEWGTRIVAVSETDGSLAEVQEVVRGQLPAYAAPRALLRLDPLPRLASGKPDRRRIQTFVERAR